MARCRRGSGGAALVRALFAPRQRAATARARRSVTENRYHVPGTFNDERHHAGRNPPPSIYDIHGRRSPAPVEEVRADKQRIARRPNIRCCRSGGTNEVARLCPGTRTTPQIFARRLRKRAGSGHGEENAERAKSNMSPRRCFNAGMRQQIALRRRRPAHATAPFVRCSARVNTAIAATPPKRNAPCHHAAARAATTPLFSSVYEPIPRDLIARRVGR